MMMEGTPLDLRLPHGKIRVILRCNPWAVGCSPEGTFYGFCMGKIGQSPKIEQLWSAVAPQLYVRTEKLTDIGNSLALGLQRGINSISLQCILWSVACSEWGTCLTPQSLGFWGQMTLEWKLFINFCPNSAFHPRFTCHGQIWRKSSVAKLPKSRLVLRTEIKDTRLFSPAFRPHLPDCTQNFVNVVDPAPVNVYQLWSGSDAVCRTYSGKIQKK